MHIHTFGYITPIQCTIITEIFGEGRSARTLGQVTQQELYWLSPH
jgi:hypothetical protein